MRCVDLRSMDVYFNLAAEEYLLKHADADYFLVWRDTPSVVIGRHQRLRAEVDTAFAREQGIGLARRYSGGGTVYHDAGNVNLTFIETSTSPDFRTYLNRTLDFLHSLGVPAVGDDRLSIYTNRGKKLSGSAQSVHKNRVLYHCTLLFDTDLFLLERVLKVPEGRVEEGRYAVPSVRSEVGNLHSFLPQVSDAGEFSQMAYQYFLLQSVTNEPYVFTSAEEAAITALRDEKYVTRAWIEAGLQPKCV